MSQYPSPVYTPGIQKPGQVQAIAIMTLISGILNILVALGWTVTAVFSIIPTVGISLLCVPVTILPGVLGIFELIYAANLMASPPKPTRPSQAIAIMEIICILSGNPYPLVVGILALVFYNDPAVQAYFAQLNASQAGPTPG